jgi:hypothetical protein
MKQVYQIIDVTDTNGKVIELKWLLGAESVHRQLRPHLSHSYVEQMERIFSSGARMSIVRDDTDVVGVAVYRIYENTCDGMMMYVDDLVTDEAKRSTGAGKLLLDYLQVLSRAANCKHFKLDSGTHRLQAHKFYFREGMVIQAFHFLKALR